jgi:hypothetical protein
MTRPLATEADPWRYKSLRHSENTRRDRDPFHKMGVTSQTGLRIQSALGGTGRSFFGASARSIAFWAAATASDLVASRPIITTPATDADHFQTPRSML